MGATTAAEPLHPDAPEGLPPGIPRNVAICLIVVPMVHGIGQSLVFAILPAVARDSGISANGVGLIYMLPAIAWSLITAWWGHRCDHWDRKPILLLSVLGFAASLLIFGGAAAGAYAGWYGAGTLWVLILLSRLLYSALSSGALPAAQAYVIDRTPAARRAVSIGRLTASWNFGTLLGPGVIGLLATFGLLTPLFATAGFALLVWVAVARTLPSQRPRHRDQRLPRLRLADPRIRGVLLIGLCGSIAQATLLQTLAYYFMDRLGTSTADTPRLVGIALMLAAIATLFSQTVLVPRLAMKPWRLETAGIVVSFCAFVGLGLGANAVGVWLATLVCGLGYGLLRPGNITRASLAVQPHEQGAVAGLNGALWSAGYIVTPVFAMPLHEADPRLPYVVACLVLLVALALNLRQRLDTVQFK
ncbi:MAG: MFS transporter [Solimonas sp.]